MTPNANGSAGVVCLGQQAAFGVGAAGLAVAVRKRGAGEAPHQVVGHRRCPAEQIGLVEHLAQQVVDGRGAAAVGGGGGLHSVELVVGEGGDQGLGRAVGQGLGAGLGQAVAAGVVARIGLMAEGIGLPDLKAEPIVLEAGGLVESVDRVSWLPASVADFLLTRVVARPPAEYLGAGGPELSPPSVGRQRQRLAQPAGRTVGLRSGRGRQASEPVGARQPVLVHAE